MASRTVADLVVRVTTDLKAAQQGLDRVAGSVSGFASKMRSGAGKAINAVATGTAALIGVTGGLAASAIKSGIAYNVLQQRSLAAFKTILGSADAANKMMADLAAFSKTSPFPRQVFIEATQQMLAFGFAAKDVIPTLDAVQNAVAAAGGGAQQITEVVDILSKVQSTGKITAETLNQLGYRGIDAAKLIADAMGTTAGDIRSQITKGTLDAGKALDLLTRQMATKFAGAAEGLKATWVGATDRIKGAMRDIGGALIAPFIDPQGGGYAVVWANQIADIFRGLEAKIAPALTGIVEKVRPALDAITNILGSIDASAFDKIGQSLSGLGPLIAPLIAGLGALGGANIAGFLGPLGAIVPTINPVFAAIAALVAVMPELRSAVMKMVPVVVGGFRQIAGILGPAIKSTMPAIRSLAQSLGTVLVSSVKAVMPAIVGLVGAIAPLLPIVGKLAQVIGSVLAAGLGVIVPVIAKLVTVLTNLPGPLKYVVTGIIALVAAQWAWNIAMTANPVGAIIVAVIALVGVIALLVKKLIGMKGMWSAIWNAMKSASIAVWNAVKAAGLAVFNVLRTGVNAVRNAFSAAFNAIRSVAMGAGSSIRAAFNAVASVARNVASSVRSAFTNAFNAIRSAASRIGSAISSAFNAVKGAVGSAVDAIRSLIGWLGRIKPPGTLRGPIDAIVSAINSAISAVKSLIGWLGKIKVPKISLPKIPGLGRSLVPSMAAQASPGLSPAALGRAAQPAALTSSGSTGAVVINVNGALDPEAVARQIRRLLNAHGTRVGLVSPGLAL